MKATGLMDQASQIAALCDLTILSGDDSLTLPLMSLGGRGVVSVVGNIVPRDMKALCNAFEKGNHALRLAIGTANMRAQAADVGPVIAQAAGVLREQRIVFDCLEDSIEVIGDGGQKAGGELGAEGSRIEQSGGRAHEIERREQLVEFDEAHAARVLKQ